MERYVLINVYRNVIPDNRLTNSTLPVA